MKTIWISAVAAAGIGGLTVAAMGTRTTPAPERAKVVLAGVTWENSLEAALARSAKENKPVLHLQMFGNLDDEFC